MGVPGGRKAVLLLGVVAWIATASAVGQTSTPTRTPTHTPVGAATVYGVVESGNPCQGGTFVVAVHIVNNTVGAVQSFHVSVCFNPVFSLLGVQDCAFGAPVLYDSMGHCATIFGNNPQATLVNGCVMRLIMHSPGALPPLTDVIIEYSDPGSDAWRAHNGLPIPRSYDLTTDNVLCGATATPTSTPTAATAKPDDYEPDNDRAQGTLLVVQDPPQRHNLHTPEDLDWAYLLAVPGKEYTIRIRNVGALINPMIAVFAPSAAQPFLIADSAGLGADETARFIAMSAGRFDILVSHQRTRSNGPRGLGSNNPFDYDLSAEGILEGAAECWSKHQIRVYWTPAPTPAVSHYTVRSRAALGPEQESGPITDGRGMYAHTELICGTTYDYLVYGWNGPLRVSQFTWRVTERTCACAGDADGDCVADAQEAWPPAAGQSNRYLYDSDGDGLPDGREDTNGNGQLDAGETNARLRDSDGDGYRDGLEKIYLHSDPLSANSPGLQLADADNDELTQTDAAGASLDPSDSVRDHDGDRYKDGYEATQLALEACTHAGWKPRLGDLNKDNAVSNVDALIAQALFIGSIAPGAPIFSGDGFVNADPNRDGMVSNLDALVIQSFFIGNLGLFPL